MVPLSFIVILPFLMSTLQYPLEDTEEGSTIIEYSEGQSESVAVMPLDVDGDVTVQNISNTVAVGAEHPKQTEEAEEKITVSSSKAEHAGKPKLIEVQSNRDKAAGESILEGAGTQASVQIAERKYKDGNSEMENNGRYSSRIINRMARFNWPVPELLQKGRYIVEQINERILEDLDQLKNVVLQRPG